MIKCKMEEGCPKGKTCCCSQCEERKSCGGVCDNLENIGNCGYSEMDETDAVLVMKTDAAAVIKAIAALTIQKKKIEEQEKEMRVQLMKAMEQYGVKKFESDSVTFTDIAPTVRNSIDSAKLKKEMPDVVAKYMKTSNVSASVKIEVKG